MEKKSNQDFKKLVLDYCYRWAGQGINDWNNCEIKKQYYDLIDQFFYIRILYIENKKVLIELIEVDYIENDYEAEAGILKLI